MEKSSGIHNAFGKTERIILGIIDGAMVPEVDICLEATMPKSQLPFFRENAGKPFPHDYVQAAKKELDNFAKILTDHGIVVDRPSPIDFSQPIITPYWSTPTGLYAAMPRDLLITIGDTIIVAPMSWRCRYREVEAYNDLLNSYATMGYNVLRAPKPKLKDDLYKDHIEDSGTFVSVLNETEPVFDAADFVVLGSIVIGQESHATNKAGIQWLRDALPEQTICILETDDDKPMHIDATITPLKEGLILINTERIKEASLRAQLPAPYNTWTIIAAPQPIVPPGSPPKYMTSDWINMNIITLDEQTAIVETAQTNLAELLEQHGFSVIKVPFQHFQCFGGSFHCATQEISRT